METTPFQKLFAGTNVDPGFPHDHEDDIPPPPSTMVYVYIAVGSVLGACVLGFAGYFTHSRWWYFEYMMARRQTKKVRGHSKMTSLKEGEGASVVRQQG